MATTRLDIVIPQSGTFRMTIAVVAGPETLEDYTGKMHIRKYKADPELLADVPENAFTIDQENSRVVVEIPSSETETYDWDGQAVYDLYLVGPEEDKWRMLEGMARLSKSVTREEV